MTPSGPGQPLQCNANAVSGGAKAAVMSRLLTDIEALDTSGWERFVDAAHETALQRAIAERALTDACQAAGWDEQFLAERFPAGHKVLHDMLAEARPDGFPYAARMAVVDAMRAILCHEVAVVTGSRLAASLLKPVELVLGRLSILR